MNTRKSRGKPRVKDDTPMKDVLTPSNSSTKKALLTSCRRLGLGRKKVIHNSPVVHKLEIENEDVPISVPTTENCEGPSTSQVTTSSSTPIDEKPMGSASRRKKSSNPLKRTIDNTDKSEGKPFQVYVTPIHKRRKLVNKDISNSDSNLQNSPKLHEINSVHDTISNDVKNKFKNSENIVLPNNDTGQNKVNSAIKTTKNYGVKVSLPLELSQKLLNTLPGSVKSEKNNLSATRSDANLSVKNKKSVELTTDVEINTSDPKKHPTNESNVSCLEMIPIKKRTVREKISKSITKEINISANDKDKSIMHTEVINNAPEVMILNNVHKQEAVFIKTDETSKQKEKNPSTTKSKTKSKSTTSHNKNKTLDLNNTSSFQENDDNLDNDFRDLTPRNKKNITIKNKKIVETKILAKKSDVKKVILDTSKAQVDNKNKKNMKRNEKNKNIENNVDSVTEKIHFDVTIPLSLVESTQLKSKNENINTLVETNIDSNVGSNLNNTVSNNVSKIIPSEKEFIKQPNLNEEKEKEHKKDIILNNNEFKLTPPTNEFEKTFENIEQPERRFDHPHIKNKAEKKIYETDNPLPTKTYSIKIRDAKSPPKTLSPRLLFKNDTKYKMDDELSYNEDSCESSHYSTPVYSPIEETEKLPEDKDLIIQQCTVTLSPYQQNDVIYECRIKNSQSPEKNINIEPICVTKECVSSFVEPSTSKDINVEFNLQEIKEKVVCEPLAPIINEINLLNNDLHVLTRELNSDQTDKISDDATVLPVLENNLEITTTDDVSSVESEPPILKRQEIRSPSPKILRKSRYDRDKNITDNKVSPTSKLKENILNDDVKTDKKYLRSSTISKTVLTCNNLSTTEEIDKLNISSEVEQEKSSETITQKKTNELLNYYPRVLINLDDIPNYYKELEMRRKKADEKIYRVNKTPVIRRKTYPAQRSTTPKSRKRKRKNSHVEQIPNEPNFNGHIQERNFIISRAQNYISNGTNEVRNKRNDKEIEKHTESVFFTPPSSRSENDSDSNRNDFQVEAELNLKNNPFGEGTSRQVVSNISEIGSTSKLTNLISTPTSQIEIIASEDHEVAGISSRGSLRKREKLKQKRKTLLPIIPSASNSISIDYDSEDDFQTPKSQPKKIPSKNYLIKNDSGVKCIIKNKSCNRMENFRLTDTSRMTAIHRGLCIEYIKSNNYSSTNAKPVESYTNKSLIQNRCSYSDHEPISSIFDSVVDDPESYIRSQEITQPRNLTHPLKREVLIQIKEIEQRIKEKQTKLERLNLINIYKKKHNFENLSKATLQMTKGAQEALLELAAVLRQRSETPFDMGTLLDNMAIPHHVVGYNIELDEFT